MTDSLTYRSAGSIGRVGPGETIGTAGSTGAVQTAGTTGTVETAGASGASGTSGASGAIGRSEGFAAGTATHPEATTSSATGPAAGAAAADTAGSARWSAVGAPSGDTLSRTPADTAARHRDSLLLPADTSLFPTDTARLGHGGLLFPADTGSCGPDVGWRDTTAQAVFGSESVAAAPGAIVPRPSDALIENAVFQGFVLLLAATYGTLLYRNLSDVRMLIGRISRDTASGQRLAEEPGSSGFSRFLNITAAIGMLFMGVMVVKYGDALIPQRLVAMLPHGAVLAMSLLATAACTAVAAFQLLATRLIGALTLSQPFTAQIVLLKRTYFALAVIVSSPALLLFALCPPGRGGVWFTVIVAELTVTALLYFRETLNLFLSKKVSILHWFLYLCTVEIFPISLLWLLAVR